MESPLERGSRRVRPAALATAGADAATGAYYDGLSRWTSWLAPFGYGGGRRTLTVHRALADPRSGGRPTFTRLHDVLAATVPTLLEGHVLDAGCGLGGTMLDLASRGGRATFVGLTLSERQAATGRRAIAAAHLADRIAIRVQSYDSPPPGPFDAVIAIESLAHSPRPGATVAALAAQLTPGGTLAIVDDMPEPAARGTQDLALFKEGWRLPALPSAAELAAAFAQCQLTLAVERDLTAEMRPRTSARIAQLEALNRLLYRLVPSPGARALLDSYHGGLALERLYRDARMSYRLLVARKPG